MRSSAFELRFDRDAEHGTFMVPRDHQQVGSVLCWNDLDGLMDSMRAEE